MSEQGTPSRPVWRNDNWLPARIKQETNILLKGEQMAEQRQRDAYVQESYRRRLSSKLYACKSKTRWESPTKCAKYMVAWYNMVLAERNSRKRIMISVCKGEGGHCWLLGLLVCSFAHTNLL